MNQLIVSILAGSAILSASCATSMPRSLEVSPLVIANCPAVLPTLADETFGATTRALIETARIYHRCRVAAMVR